MTLNGEFIAPRKAPIGSRILLWAIIIAVIGGALSLAAFALWLALLILPVALAAAVIAWGVYRFQVWRAAKSLGGQRNLWRP